MSERFVVVVGKKGISILVPLPRIKKLIWGNGKDKELKPVVDSTLLYQEVMFHFKAQCSPVQTGVCRTSCHSSLCGLSLS
jgi:hypothetical protein